jgi:transcriptional regulator with XRE-family HTH domain
MKKPNQAQIAENLGISKSYLSMILSGQRKCPPELAESLQSIPGIHKVVNNQLWTRTGSQKVVGSNPISSTSIFPALITTICLYDNGIQFYHPCSGSIRP